MSKGGPDELAGGADREPVRLPSWLKVLGALLALAIVGYLVVRSDDEGAPAPQAEPSPSVPVAPREPVTATGYPPLEGPLVLAGQTCVTTQPGTFTVQFGLQNVGTGPVTVLSISAHLPIGGLQPTGGRVPALRSCGGAEVDAATSTVLEPGGRLPVSVGFELPAECPAPYPVQADVSLAGAGDTTTQRVVVLVDLGAYQDAFAACGQSTR